MKLNYLAILAATTLLTVSCTAEKPSVETSIQPEPSTTPTTEVTESTQTAPQATKISGTFVKVDYPIKGTVNVVTEEGKSYLEFDQAFQTDEGPDVFVLLHRSDKPESYQEEDYVSLGKLKQFSGTQKYAIPADLNLAKFSSVVIWCRKFNVTFGYAPLSS